MKRFVLSTQSLHSGACSILRLTFPWFLFTAVFLSSLPLTLVGLFRLKNHILQNRWQTWWPRKLMPLYSYSPTCSRKNSTLSLKESFHPKINSPAIKPLIRFCFSLNIKISVNLKIYHPDFFFLFIFLIPYIVLCGTELRHSTTVISYSPT